MHVDVVVDVDVDVDVDVIVDAAGVLVSVSHLSFSHWYLGIWALSGGDEI